MADLYEYTDFRQYLKAFYDEQKRMNRHFSYNLLSQKAGFKNKGFLYNIMHGSKHISKSSIYKLAVAMKLSRSESDYFENMVAFGQAKDPEEKKHYFERMVSAKKGTSASPAQIVRKDQYEFYSSWFFSAIWSLIDMYDFNGDFEWLAESLDPPIRPRDARSAVELLERLGLVTRGSDGVYRIISKTISTGNDILGTALQNYHHDKIQLALRALKKTPRQSRYITDLTLGISRKTHDRLVEEIQCFQEKILRIATEDTEADRVYQLNLQLFPLTQENLREKRKAT